MHGWPFHQTSSPIKKWADDVVQLSLDSGKNTTPMAPTASTAVEEGLPVPVFQAGRYTASFARRQKRHPYTRIQQLWEQFKHHIGSGTAPSSSSINEDTAIDHSYSHRVLDDARDDAELDEVVVDRIWSEEIHSTLSHLSEQDITSPDKSGNPDDDSVAHDDSSPPSHTHALVWLQYRLWQSFMAVFSCRFADERKEFHYAQEDWFVKKPLALVTSLWWICNWVLGCIFVRISDSQFTLADKVFYFGLAPVLSIPVVFMVMWDWPRDRQYMYQAYLIVSIWCWPAFQVIFINLCGLYSRPNNNDCHGRDFLPTFYYTTALQTIGFFGLKLNRFPAAIGALAYLLLASITIIPDRQQWIRSMINFFVYHAFLIYVHYMREGSERRLYTLRDQLKMQYKATQRAQMNERKASESKRRLTSYVFHEVRVPLNTALIAVQNMGASGAVAKSQEIEFNALSGSLMIMSKVLNDVLDFNRMDSGRFESASKPYNFIKVMRSLFAPLRMAAGVHKLELETSLDPRIEQIARILHDQARGDLPEDIRRQIHRELDDDAKLFVGDEERLRQIVNNLAGNALKFTPEYGKLTVKVELVRPQLSRNEDPFDYVFPPVAQSSNMSSTQRPLSVDYLSQHNYNTKDDKSPETIVVRIEVTDTGYGIRPQDMVNNKLFSAFNQTERGIQQGGKGTGLGLALVRQIVKVSGGRLGVKSKAGHGSTFWVELPLGVGQKAVSANAQNANSHLSASSSETSRSAGRDPASRRTHFALYETAGNRPIVPMNAARFATMPGRLASTLQFKTRLPNDLSEVGPSGQDPPNSDSDSQPHDIRPMTRAERQTDETPPSPPIELSQLKRAPGDAHIPLDEEKALPQKIGGDSSRLNRPTYVPLPSPPAFTEDDFAGHGGRLPPSPGASTPGSSRSSPLVTTLDHPFAHGGTPSSSTAALNGLSGLNVLVVDDDSLTRTLMSRLLTRLGCQVTTAENGEVAVDLIMGSKGWAGTPSSDVSRQSGPILEQPRRPPGDLSALERVPEEERFAVVFLDNQMPVMSGLRAVERLRQLGRKDFVVGVTGNALLSDQHEYLDAGADRILTKPVLERSLREILVAADDRRKALLKEAASSSSTDSSLPSQS